MSVSTQPQNQIAISAKNCVFFRASKILASRECANRFREKIEFGKSPALVVLAVAGSFNFLLEDNICYLGY